MKKSLALIITVSFAVVSCPFWPKHRKEDEHLSKKEICISEFISRPVSDKRYTIGMGPFPEHPIKTEPTYYSTPDSYQQDYFQQVMIPMLGQ